MRPALVLALLFPLFLSAQADQIPPPLPPGQEAQLDQVPFPNDAQPSKSSVPVSKQEQETEQSSSEELPFYVLAFRLLVVVVGMLAFGGAVMGLFYLWDWLVPKPEPVSRKSPRIHARIVSTHLTSSQQPPTPLTSPVHSQQEELNRLRDSCLSKFRNKPIRKPPIVKIGTPSPIPLKYLAQYNPNNNVIWFTHEYLASKPSFESKTDTMLHELLHCWLDEVGWAAKQKHDHDDYFEQACQLLGIRFEEYWRQQETCTASNSCRT